MESCLCLHRARQASKLNLLSRRPSDVTGNSVGGHYQGGIDGVNIAAGDGALRMLQKRCHSRFRESKCQSACNTCMPAEKIRVDIGKQNSAATVITACVDQGLAY